MNNNSIIRSCIISSPSSQSFGDNLLTYLHAKWISCCYEMPLLCVHQSFPYVSQLKLYEKEIDFSCVPRPRSIVQLNSNCPEPQKRGSVAYVVPYFPESDWDYEMIHTKWDYSIEKQTYLFQVNWNDLGFRNIALEMISPRFPLTLTFPPKNTINIAIHAYMGTHDSKECQFQFPIKLPPLSYYCNCLKKILNLLPKDKPIHCQIFTDASDPISIMNSISNTINHALITFDCRVEISSKNSTIESFFSFFHYDILIRSGSNLSIIPSLLHDYAIVGSPRTASSHQEANKKFMTIDKIDLHINEDLYSSLLAR